MAENGQPDNSKRPRRISMTPRRLHPRQQCSSAVVTRNRWKSAAFERGAPSGDSPAGQGRSSLQRSEEHTSELQSREKLVCRLLLEKKKTVDKRRGREKRKAAVFPLAGYDRLHHPRPA